MSSPEEQSGKRGSLSIWLTLGGTLLFIVGVVAYVFYNLKVEERADPGTQITAESVKRASFGQDGHLPALKWTRKTCETHPCGTGATCQEPKNPSGAPSCACPLKHTGDPTSECVEMECTVDDECVLDRICKDYKCVEPCKEPLCGLNAICEVIRHTPVCSCSAGFGGNPFIECKATGPDNMETDPCTPSPCGNNSACQNFERIPICSCLPGFKGSPPFCRPECESDEDCETKEACRDSKCVSPCENCGDNAFCQASNHSAVCECFSGYSGDPYIKCVAECETDDDCPSERSQCARHHCVDPCIDSCGINAVCSNSRNQIYCSCPERMTGDPHLFCRPLNFLTRIHSYNLCKPNPCGANATCSPMQQNSTREWYPHCTCLSGFFGKSHLSCQQIECEHDSECPDNKDCNEFQCVDPCKEKHVCGLNAICSPSNGRAICTCRTGTIGDPFQECLSKKAAIALLLG